MAGEAQWETNRQAKVLDMLKRIGEDQVLLKESVLASLHTEVKHSLVVESTSLLLTKLDLLAEELNYLFEFSNCRQIMLSENIIFIKKLEQEIAELKLQIQ